MKLVRWAVAACALAALSACSTSDTSDSASAATGAGEAQLACRSWEEGKSQTIDGVRVSFQEAGQYAEAAAASNPETWSSLAKDLAEIYPLATEPTMDTADRLLELSERIDAACIGYEAWQSPMPANDAVAPQSASGQATATPDAVTPADTCGRLTETVSEWAEATDAVDAHRRVAQAAAGALEQLRDGDLAKANRSLSKTLPKAIEDVPVPMREIGSDVFSGCRDSDAKSVYAVAIRDNDGYLLAYSRGLGGLDGGFGSLDSWLDAYRRGGAGLVQTETDLVLSNTEEGFGLSKIIAEATDRVEALGQEP